MVSYHARERLVQVEGIPIAHCRYGFGGRKLENIFSGGGYYKGSGL